MNNKMNNRFRIKIIDLTHKNSQEYYNLIFSKQFKNKYNKKLKKKKKKIIKKNVVVFDKYYFKKLILYR